MLQWSPLQHHGILARAHFAVNTSSITPTLLLENGASHHVIADLSILSFHASYDGFDEIMIDDDTGLPITHTDSTFLTTPKNI